MEKGYLQYMALRKAKLTQMEKQLKNFDKHNKKLKQSFDKYVSLKHKLQLDIDKAKLEIRCHKNLEGKYITFMPCNGSNLIYYIHINLIMPTYYEGVQFHGPCIIRAIKSGDISYNENGLEYIYSTFYSDIFNNITLISKNEFNTLKNIAVHNNHNWNDMLGQFFDLDY